MSRWSFILLGTLSLVQLGRADTDPVTAAKVEYFEKKVRPILVNHCYSCHAADTKPAGGLRVDDRNGLLTGGNNGPAIVVGKADDSLLLKRIEQKTGRRMPLESEPLSAEQVAILKQWINDGAAWPALRVPTALGKPKPRYEQLKRAHWAWQPLTTPTVPTSASTWARTDVDRLVQAHWQAQQLTPAADATKSVLGRRLYFDLVGLPPTPAQLDEFVNDSRPDALAQWVDRLLASPQFGERWGRHWLDVARYGESTGPSRNIPYPHAWKYRDYVLDAVNADVPIDRFITEQIAGDLLPADTDAERNRLRTATGFLALGVKDVNQRFKVRFEMDNVDEQIDAVTRSVLGLTVSCARCHDHKFDPIPTTDYYALAGIFTSTVNAAGVRSKMGGGGLDYYDPAALVVLAGDLPPVPTEQVAKLKTEVEQAKKEWEAIRGTPEGLSRGANGQPKQRPFRLKYERLQAELLAVADPAARGFAVHGVRDTTNVGDTPVRLRGEAEKLGPTVPRGFLTTFAVPDAVPIDPRGSGRRELAGWLTSAQNPLTARVFVNRVWHHLFGRGLVSTVDNFGTTGAEPSHPALLDHLAQQFIRDGWSLKKLIRSIVLTRTYQLSSATSAAQRERDPANVFLSRHTPRRLDAEQTRDAVLAVAGTLTLTRPTAPVQKLKMIELRDNGPEAKALHEHADQSTARSVYLPWLRGLTPHTLEVFDPVEQTLVTGQRDTTTVPAQALFLLNHAFVRKQALALAERVQADVPNVEDRITQIYRRVLGRAPTTRENTRAQKFLAEFVTDYRPPPTAQVVASEKPKPTAPIVDPDQVDQTAEPIVEERIQPKDAHSAAWLALVQALLASAEFRYVQ
jgi:hypothetical protein